MHLVALCSLPQDKEALADRLAGVLKLTRHEALMRLRAPGSGPLVVSFMADEERARLLAEELHAAGFAAMVVTQSEVDAESEAGIVRTFSFGDEALTVEMRGGRRCDVRFADVALILRFVGINSRLSLEKEESRSFSLGRTVLSGGLVMSKTTKKEREVVSEDRELFLHLYAGEPVPFRFGEQGLIYDGLGSARSPSRAENFACLTRELRRRCAQAVYDERLQTKPGQAALLGPSLSPERNIAAATAVLSKVLRGMD